MANVQQNENVELNELLRTVDAEQIANNAPILSVIVEHTNGDLCSVAWESIEKYNLRQPGESDADMITRLRNAAHLFYANSEGQA